MQLAPILLCCLANISTCTVLDSDPNANLFSRLLPVFAEEAEQAVAQRKSPLLGGETELSMEEASKRVKKLVDMGILDQAKGSKLINSLHFASNLRQIASLMDGVKLAKRA